VGTRGGNFLYNSSNCKFRESEFCECVEMFFTAAATATLGSLISWDVFPSLRIQVKQLDQLLNVTLMIYSSVCLVLEMMNWWNATKRASCIHHQPLIDTLSMEAVLATRYTSEGLFGFEFWQAYRACPIIEAWNTAALSKHHLGVGVNGGLIEPCWSFFQLRHHWCLLSVPSAC